MRINEKNGQNYYKNSMVFLGRYRKSIWETRERELNEELRAKEDDFLSNQLRRIVSC